MDSEKTAIILPAILDFVWLRRTMTNIIPVGEKGVRIGANIPPYSITTMELAMKG